MNQFYEGFYRMKQLYIVYTNRDRTNLFVDKDYLIKVVLPTPGGPITKMEPPSSTKSCMISALPVTARPTRHVRPIICILRLRIALIRCKELLIPDRLSSENSPT